MDNNLQTNKTFLQKWTAFWFNVGYIFFPYFLFGIFSLFVLFYLGYSLFDSLIVGFLSIPYYLDMVINVPVYKMLEDTPVAIAVLFVPMVVMIVRFFYNKRKYGYTIGLKYVGVKGNLKLLGFNLCYLATVILSIFGLHTLFIILVLFIYNNDVFWETLKIYITFVS